MKFGEEEDREINNNEELKECDTDQLFEITNYTRLFLSEQHWELTFLYLCVFLFSAWFGMTAKSFEVFMKYCSLSIILSFLIYLLSRLSTEEILKANSQNVFFLSIFFTISVCIFHFFRLKADPSSIA